MNRREVFTTVKDHLLKQMAVSQSLGGSCLYRSPEGLRCALGVLIKDEHFDSRWNDRTPRDHEGVANAIAKSLGCETLTWDDISFLMDLQCIHDDGKPENWSSKLDAFEKDHFGDKS